MDPGELRRMDDIMIGQLIRELKDFKEQNLAWQQAHDDKSNDWRDSIDERLKPIEEFMSNANWSWKIVVGFATVAAGVGETWHFISSHWK